MSATFRPYHGAVCDVIYWDDLTPQEQRDHDWAEARGCSFFRYRDWCYCLDDFMVGTVPPSLPGHWDAFASDSFFSGVAVRIVDDGDRIAAALCY
jgi:hypothetical protein